MYTDVLSPEEAAVDRHEAWLRRRWLRRLYCHGLQVQQKGEESRVSFIKWKARRSVAVL